MVSLWDLLTILSGASAFGGALAAAKIAGGGAGKLVVGTSLGLVTGFYPSAQRGRRGDTSIDGGASK
jgi:hypothetical protein